MKNMLFLGDSLIDGGDWPSLLEDHVILNRGIPGECVEELAARVVEEISAAEHVDAVLIASGANNLLFGNPHFPPVFESMLPTIRMLFPDMPLIVNSLLPMPAVNRKELDRNNAALMEISGQITQCSFLDAVPAFDENCLPITHPGFLNDLVHLSTRGYLVWAQAMKEHFSTLT